MMGTEEALSEKEKEKRDQQEKKEKTQQKCASSLSESLYNPSRKATDGRQRAHLRA